MSRNRVRRSFTVETKARGRQAPATLPVRAPLIEQPSPAFPSLEAAALFGAGPARPAEAETAPVGRPAPRRILPSLIAAPAAEPEEAEEAASVAREPRLPRVRRVKLPRTAAPAEPARAEPEPASRPEAAPAPVGSAQPTSTQPRSVQAKPAEPVRRSGRRAEKALPLGERWKRRLPRVCW